VTETSVNPDLQKYMKYKTFAKIQIQLAPLWLLIYIYVLLLR